MADRLIRAGIVLTGDAASAVAAFRESGNRLLELKRRFSETQGEVERLSRELKAFRSVGVTPAGLVAELDTARASVRALAGQVESQKTAFEGAKRSMAQYGVSAGAVRQDLARLEAQALVTAQTQSRISAAMAQGKTASDSVSVAIGGVTRQFAGLAGGALILSVLRSFILVSDAFSSAEQRIALVTRSSVELDRVQESLFASAQRTRTSFLDQAESFSRVARAAQEAGFSNTRLLAINETISKAAIIGGGAIEAQRAALVQFSQALSSNRFGGDELRSVSEQAPRLFSAIADGLGKTQGELRELGAQGALTTEVILEALEKSAGKVNSEFARLPPTAGQAFQVLKNSVGNVADKINDVTNATSVLADAQIALARIIDFAASGDLDKLFPKSGERALGVKEAFEAYREGERDIGKAATATREFLDIQAKLSGINDGFSKDLNTLFDAYRKGVVPVERYRELVAKLIETDTEAGKAAKAASDARLKAQRDLVEKSIGDQQRLVDATRKAFEDSLSDAKKFAKQASDLREEAGDVQRAASGRAAERRNQSRKPEVRDAGNAVRASILIDQANAASRRSGAASAAGDAEAALKLAERAKKLAEEAGQFADKVTDDNRAANLIELAGSAAARAIEAAAKAADAQAQNAKTAADAQAQTLLQLEDRLKALQAAAASVPVKLETEGAMAQFEALRALFGQGFTVPLRTAANDAQGFAYGGLLRGPGSGTSDSILARVSNGEFVQRAAAVEHYGVAFMERLNRLQVPRFSAGGLVERVRVREPAGVSSTTINLTLPGVGTFPVSAEAGVADDLTRGIQRAALKRGRR